MIRMEIALILVLAFVAYIYFSAGRRHTLLHRTFSVLLVTALVHLVFDALTVYTVARLDSVRAPSTTCCTGFSSAVWCWWCIFFISTSPCS